MKKDKSSRSETNNSGVSNNSVDKPGTTEESASHKEVKVLLALVAGVLILLIGGSAFLNFQNSDDPQLAAMEEALLNNKSRMLREYDPLLVRAVEIHDYEVTHRSRNYKYIAVNLAIPNLQEVYDYYFDEMITQEVWLREDPQSSLQDIYQEAVEQAGMSVHPLGEELLLREEDGGWQVGNPEVLDLVLPYNPTEEIARDFESVLAEMGRSLEFPDRDREPVLQEVMEILMDEDFFNEISFDWHRDQEGQNYRITANLHEIKKMAELGSLEDFRHRREEIVDRQSLVDIILEEIRERTQNERDLRIFEIREYDQQSNNDWGYRLISRGGHTRYYRQLMEDVATFPHIARVSFQHLEKYYKATHVTAEAPWPKALRTPDYEKQQVVARYHEGEDRRKLILEDGELWYRIYDPISLEVLEEIIIHDDIQQEDVLDESLSPYYRNEIKRRNGYDLVIYGINGKHSYRVNWEPELTATKLTLDVGNFHREEIFYLANRPYHMGELGEGKDRELKMIQLTDVENGQILIDKSYSEMSGENETVRGNFFISEAHDTLIVYYQGPEELLEEKFPGNSLQIFRGTEGRLVANDTLNELFRHIGGIKNFMVMDQNRIFLTTHQKEQWILDLDKNIKISAKWGLLEEEAVNTEAAVSVEGETEEEPQEEPEGEVYGEFEDHHYRFTPLSDNRFLAELFIHSSSRDDVLLREIWTVKGEIERNIIFSENEKGYSLSYSLEDEVFIVMKENQELLIFDAEINALTNSSGDNAEIKIEDLMDHEAFTLLDSYQNVNEGLELGQLMIYGQHSFFSSNHKFHSTHNQNYYNPFRYDRNTGNLIYTIPGGDPYMRVLQRDTDHQPLPLWDYEELTIDRDFNTLYYRDHEGTRIYDLNAFLESLKLVSSTNH